MMPAPARLAREFRAVFGEDLRKYWDVATGFDLVAFEATLRVGEDESMRDYVEREHGHRGVHVVHSLISYPVSRVDASRRESVELLRDGEVWLVGEANPYGGGPERALYPHPTGSAGERLCRVVLGMGRVEYLRRFKRVNLCESVWDPYQAREVADRLAVGGGWKCLVLLGARVHGAFHLRFNPFTAAETALGRVVSLPHPSGRSRLWNAPGSVERARGVLRRSGVLP